MKKDTVNLDIRDLVREISVLRPDLGNRLRKWLGDNLRTVVVTHVIDLRLVEKAQIDFKREAHHQLKHRMLEAIDPYVEVIEYQDEYDRLHIERRMTFVDYGVGG